MCPVASAPTNLQVPVHGNGDARLTTDTGCRGAIEARRTLHDPEAPGQPVHLAALLLCSWMQSKQTKGIRAFLSKNRGGILDGAGGSKGWLAVFKVERDDGAATV